MMLLYVPGWGNVQQQALNVNRGKLKWKTTLGYICAKHIAHWIGGLCYTKRHTPLAK